MHFRLKKAKVEGFNRRVLGLEKGGMSKFEKEQLRKKN